MTDTSYLPFSRPTLGEDEIAAVADVLRSGWITTGRHCLELERDCAALVGARAAVALSSATAGMHLVLLALGIGPGDEVVTPSMTWVSTANLITLLGATPVFADVERDTLMVTRATVEPLVTERTRAILPVHYAGMPLDLDPLRALAAERGVALVEDAAHAIGTHHRQSPVGSSGTAIFSLHPIKNVTTGEGGIVVSDDQALVERLRRLRFHGLGVDAFDREVQGRSPQSEVLEPGLKYNLPDMNAVIGVVQLRRLEDFIRRRSELAALYAEELASVEAILPLAPPPVPGRHAWHLYVVRLDTERAGLSREELMAALAERGIGSGIHFKAAHLHRFYREREESRRASLPWTEWNSSRLLSLPLFPTMVASDVRRVTGALREILG